MLTIVRYVLITALRDRLFLALLIAVAAAAGVSAVLAGTALEEAHAMRLVFSAAAARLIVVMGTIVFVVFHIRQAYDAKEIDVLLSRPFSRATLVFSYWMGFAAVALLLAAIAIGAVAALSPENMPGFFGWAASLVLEVWLVAALALFLALMLKSASAAVMAGLGFYILSRMLGFFLATSQAQLIFKDPLLNHAVRYTIDAIALFVPRLDFFAKSGWLVYGFAPEKQEVMFFAVQGGIFIPLLLLAAILDFRKRQF